MKNFMKKIARQILKKDNDGNPICVAIIYGTSEVEMLKLAQAYWGNVYLWPCSLDMTVEQANKPIANEKMRNYGGFE